MIEPRRRADARGLGGRTGTPARRACWPPPSTWPPPVVRPTRCCGRCGTAPAGPGGWPRGRGTPGRRPGPPTATSTRCWRCSRRPVGSRTGSPAPGSAGLLEEVAGQEIPAAPFEERGGTLDTVRLLTAHRSKGLEWDLVVVADVQEGVWPDLRRRGSLLEADRLDVDGPRSAPSPAALLTEERRLFYVALTRARSRLVVTAVSGVDDLADRPSRFLDETGLAVPDAGPGPHRRAVGTVARRSAAADVAGPRGRSGDCAPRRRSGWPSWPTRPTTDGVALAARRRPPALVGDGGGDRRATAGAAHGRSRSRSRGRPSHRSRPARGHGSSTGRPRRARPRRPRRGSARWSTPSRRRSPSATVPAELDALVERLDTVWPALPFDAPWQRVRERAGRDRGARPVPALAAAEPSVGWPGRSRSSTVSLGDDIVLRGRADRLELDEAGRLVVVDLKTGKYPPANAALEHEPQLGVYQLAVREGGFGEAGRSPGGAELLQLRKSVGGAPEDPAAAAARRRRPVGRRAGARRGRGDPRGSRSRLGPTTAATAARSAPRARLARRAGRWCREPRSRTGAPIGRYLCELLGTSFTDRQLDVITAPLRPQLVVAGAGSGKTTVMAARRRPRRRAPGAGAVTDPRSHVHQQGRR